MKKTQPHRQPKRNQPRTNAAPPETRAPRAAGSQDISRAQRNHIAQLVELLKEHNLTELELERDGVRVRVRRDFFPSSGQSVAWENASAGQVAQPEPSAEPTPTAEVPGGIPVTSPIVGTFYRSPSPDADPYVSEGDLVKKGQVLCIVEAMKLMNEIESELDGRIVKILAESTKPVEYGQPLFLIAPASAS